VLGLTHRLSGRPARGASRPPALDAADLALVIISVAVGVALVLVSTALFIQMVR